MANSSEGDPHETKATPHRMELALDPGTFIHDRACFSFVSGLEEVSAKIGDLIASDPARATVLYETFLAGCGAKTEELDDSSGSFGQFAADLICAWLKARQASGADPDQTAATLLGSGSICAASPWRAANRGRSRLFRRLEPD